MLRLHSGFPWVFLLAACTVPPPAELVLKKDGAALDAEVRQLVARAGPGVRAAVWLGTANGRQLFAWNADQSMPAASAIKTAYLVELFAAFAADLDQRMPGNAAVLDDAGNAAVVHFSTAARTKAKADLGSAAVRRVGEAMITGRGVDNLTYNLAANLVTAHFGGPAALQARLHARDPAWRGIQVRRYMLANRTENGDNEATPRALAAVLGGIAGGRVRGIDARALIAAREILARPPGADGVRYQKGGSLDTMPMTRVSSGYRVSDGGTAVWVVMLAQDEKPPGDAAAAGQRLQGLTQSIVEQLLAAVP